MKSGSSRVHDDRGRRPSIRQQQKAQTHQLLRAAAIDLFAEQGYTRTTIDHITSAVGTSRATFYLHFDAKWQVVHETHEMYVMPETFDYYRRLNALGVPSQDELREWLDDAIGFYERHRTLLVINAEANAVEPELQRASATWLSRCADEMPNYLQRWTGSEREEARLRLELMILQLSRFAVQWVTGNWEADRKIVLAVLLDLWSSGLHINERS
jgi:AcrR family transcriptional regulator